MAAARWLGLAVRNSGTLGSGAVADRIAKPLAVEGITPLRPRHPTLGQDCCAALIDEAGERSFIASKGEDGVVTDADLAS